MEAQKVKSTGLIWLVTVAAFMIVVAGLKSAQPILVPFLFGVFLAILGSVPLGLFLRGSTELPTC